MEKINILWTTTNKDTVINMISMYSINSIKNNWWKTVNVIIWGASAKLIGSDPEIQMEVQKMLGQGVLIEACKACSDNFGVTDKLVNLGINVRYMGEPLTGYIKNDEKVLTI